MTACRPPRASVRPPSALSLGSRVPVGPNRGPGPASSHLVRLSALSCAGLTCRVAFRVVLALAGRWQSAACPGPCLVSVAWPVSIRSGLSARARWLTLAFVGPSLPLSGSMLPVLLLACLRGPPDGSGSSPRLFPSATSFLCGSTGVSLTALESCRPVSARFVHLRFARRGRVCVVPPALQCHRVASRCSWPMPSRLLKWRRLA